MNYDRWVVNERLLSMTNDVMLHSFSTVWRVQGETGTLALHTLHTYIHISNAVLTLFRVYIGSRTGNI